MSTINILLLHSYLHDADMGSHGSPRDDSSMDLKLTQTKTGLSPGYGGKSPPPPLVNNTGSQRTTPTIRKISSVDGLTEDEQDKIAAILVSLLSPYGLA
jgi:hypothetical protein